MSNNVDENFLTNIKNESTRSPNKKLFVLRKEEKIRSTQNWIPIEKFCERGILKINKNKYVKIVKIKPVNFNLKTQLEKEAILNSYKLFLKSCNFDIQILIQSKKEDLENHFQIIKKSEESKKGIIKTYSEEYIKFLKEKSKQNRSASKNIYLIIKNDCIKEEKNILEENIFQDLNDKFFKVKEYLLKCGNIVTECNKDETIEILFSFLNSKKFLSK